MATPKLTLFETLALRALCTPQAPDQRPVRFPPSAIGYAIHAESDPETRKRNPSPQGMALFAAKFLRRLRQLELAHQHDGWYISRKGREHLRQLDAADNEQ